MKLYARLLASCLTLYVGACTATYTAPPNITPETGAMLQGSTRESSDATNGYTTRLKINRIDGILTRVATNALLSTDTPELLAPGRHTVEVFVTLRSLMDNMSARTEVIADLQPGTLYTLRSTPPKVDDRLVAEPLQIWLESADGTPLGAPIQILPEHHMTSKRIMVLPSGGGTPTILYQ